MNSLKPTDKAMPGMVSEFPGRNTGERSGSLVSSKHQWPSLYTSGEGSMTFPKWTETGKTHWRGDSDSMEARTHGATGEALLTPGESSGSKVSPITKAREKG